MTTENHHTMIDIIDPTKVEVIIVQRNEKLYLTINVDDICKLRVGRIYDMSRITIDIPDNMLHTDILQILKRK